MEHQKVCSACLKGKALSEFYTSKRGRQCKKCLYERARPAVRNWQMIHAIRVKRHGRYWRSKNPIALKINGMKNMRGVPAKELRGRLEKMYADGPNCAYCNVNLRIEKMSLDHIIPISRGGSSNDPGNMAICCWDCNRLKWTMTATEFKAFLIDYVARFNGQYRAEPEKSGRCNDQGINPISAPGSDQGLRYDLSHLVTNGSGE